MTRHLDPPAQLVTRPRVTMGTFVEYLSAFSSARIDCVARQRETYESQYIPGADFYGDIKKALREGRRHGTDEFEIQSAIRRQRDENRIKHYEAIRAGWLQWLDKFVANELLPVGHTMWSTSSLDVSIKPELGLVDHDGGEYVVKLWLKAAPLNDEAVKAALRLLNLHMDQLRPGARAAVLDVRRSKLHLPNRRRINRNYDSWLEAEAASFAHLWSQVGRRRTA